MLINSCGYITMSIEDAQKLAHKAIYHVIKTRMNKLKNEAMFYQKPRWFGLLKPMSKNDAIRHVYRNYIRSFGHDWWYYAWGTLYKAKEIKKACRFAKNGVINLTLEEIELLI